MEVTSVNIGREQPIAGAKQGGTTGIYKTPVGGPVEVGRGGLPGDMIVNQESHGGVDQAVYVYGGDDYAWWSTELGHALEPGTFGENLTIAGVESARLSVGDRLHIGNAVLEVTSPRMPCSTLAARMDDPTFVKRFRQAERPGFYCRVIREGLVGPGDPVLVEPYTGETLTIGDMFRSYYEDAADEALIRRHLAAPIAIRARITQEERLHKLLGSS